MLLISDSSSSDSSSSSSSDEDDSDGEEEEEGSKPKGPQNKKKSKAEFSIHDLPPIEDLHITVPEHECVELGQVWMLTKLFYMGYMVTFSWCKFTPSLQQAENH